MVIFKQGVGHIHFAQGPKIWVAGFKIPKILCSYYKDFFFNLKYTVWEIWTIMYLGLLYCNFPILIFKIKAF